MGSTVKRPLSEAPVLTSVCATHAPRVVGNSSAYTGSGADRTGRVIARHGIIAYRACLLDNGRT